MTKVIINIITFMLLLPMRVCLFVVTFKYRILNGIMNKLL